MNQSPKKTRFSNDVIRVTGMQEKILRELGNYKYLTVSQLIKLKVGVRNRIYESIKVLVSAGLVQFADYKALLRYGQQLERIHFLTRKGATFLVSHTPNLHLDHIRYPKSTTTLFTHDYFHRVSSINTHISFITWLNSHDFSLIGYYDYFDVIGSRKKHSSEPMKAVTRIEFGNEHFLDPDGIAIYDNQGKPKITLIETYNGKNTKRVIEQLRKHIYIIKHGLAAYKFNLQAPTRVCCTFEDENARNAVIKSLQTDPYFQFTNVEYYFFFGVAEKVWSDFEHSFMNIQGKYLKMSNLNEIEKA